MSNAAKIQAEYDQLEQIAAQFAQQGDRTAALGRQVYNCMSQLRDGGWIGVGANRFYNEMESLVMPAVDRLAKAMDAGSSHTKQIAQILRTAEEEAGNLFYGGDSALGGTAAAGGAVDSAAGLVGGGMNLGGMIGMAVGGMLGGPLGAMLGARIGNAIGAGPFSASGTLSIGDVGKSKPFSPLKMFKNYLGSDPTQYKSKFGHDFSKRHLFGAYAKGDDKKFINRSVDGKVVLAGGELWNQRGAALRGDLNFQAGALKGNVFGELASYDTSGKWEASVGRDGVKLAASGQAGIYAARVGVNAELGGAQVAGQAYIGAQVQGEAAAVLRAGQAYVGAGGEVFAGGKAEGSLSYTQQIVDGLSVKGTASGYVSYGVGAQFDVKFGYDEGKIRLGGSVGATLGVGAGAKFDITIDAKGIVDQGVRTVQEVGRNIADFGRGVVDIGRLLFSW